MLYSLSAWLPAMFGATSLSYFRRHGAISRNNGSVLISCRAEPLFHDNMHVCQSVVVGSNPTHGRNRFAFALRIYSTHSIEWVPDLNDRGPSQSWDLKYVLRLLVVVSDCTGSWVWNCSPHARHKQYTRTGIGYVHLWDKQQKSQ